MSFFNKDKDKDKNTPKRKPIALRITYFRNDQLNHGKMNKLAVDINDSQLERIIAIAHETERNHAE